ncbi:serine/threonine protein kinase [Actinobacteria bacterium OK074]|nr:serine/threonine protein kinase [Actinobacteria bacterium OK074]
MSQQRPVPTGPASDEAAALRQTGAVPLRLGDPEQVGPYVPLALLGSGGMGRVYLARPVDHSPGLVAVKVIRPEYADDPRFRRRFEREASVHDRVRTRHTPRLCGTGFRDELLWMATEYLPGLDLADAVQEDGALTTATVWLLTAELGQALADLAAAGIVHRDLKPSNVLLSARGAHVIDFGISTAVDASAITGTGNRVGTPAYMSPEHLRTGTSTTASDVFSLAGTLIYAATGRAPFGDGTGVDVMHRVAFEEPNATLLGELTAADPALGALLSTCLAKEPERRPTPQDLVNTATAYADPAAVYWPEPLGTKVRARQQAYETLQLGVRGTGLGARQESPREAGQQKESQEATPPHPTPTATPTTVPSPSPGHRRLTAAWTRRKRLLAVAASIALCATVAGIVVLTRQDSPATAYAPGAGTATTAAPAPGGAAGRPTPGPSDGGPAEGTSDERGTATAPTDTGPTVDDGTSPSNGASQPPAAVPGTPADATTPPTGTDPSEPATPPWIANCTYYSGNGRTGEGDTGKRVVQVQCILTNRGYDIGSDGVDGEFGPATDSAVRAFQTDRDLTVDGVVGHDTWVSLRDTV